MKAEQPNAQAFQAAMTAFTVVSAVAPVVTAAKAKEWEKAITLGLPAALVLGNLFLEAGGA